MTAGEYSSRPLSRGAEVRIRALVVNVGHHSDPLFCRSLILPSKRFGARHSCRPPLADRLSAGHSCVRHTGVDRNPDDLKAGGLALPILLLDHICAPTLLF